MPSALAFSRFARAAFCSSLITFTGFVKELNDEYRAEQIEQKKRARESQRERREWELDDRRTQTAALVTALNAVVKVMERLETG